MALEASTGSVGAQTRSGGGRGAGGGRGRGGRLRRGREGEMDVEGLARMIQEGAGRGGDMGGSEESQEVSRQSRSLSGNSRGGSRILGLLLWHLGGGVQPRGHPERTP